MTPASHEKSPRSALAIVSDARRRAGFRVARVYVRTVLEMGAAEVEEIALRPVTHWLPFARLSTRGPRDLGVKLRDALAAAQAELAPVEPSPEPSAEPSAPAVARRPAHAVTHDRANGYQPEFADTESPLTAVAESAAAGA